MEMETPLQEETPVASPESQVPGPTDGLAAALAVEHGASGTATGPPEAFGPAKRRGRPPIHGLYSQAAGSDGKHAVPLPGSEPLPAAEVESPGETRVSIPSELVTQIVGETLSVAENYASYKLVEVASKAGLTTGEINPQLQRAQIGDRRKQIVAELTPLALQEWGLDPQISPTAAIGLILGPWLFASVSAYFTLAGLAAEKLAMEKRRGKPVETAVEIDGEKR